MNDQSRTAPQRITRRAVLAAGGGLLGAALLGGKLVAAQSPVPYGPMSGGLVHPPRSTLAANGYVHEDIPVNGTDYALSTTFRNPYPALNSNTFDQQFRTPDTYRQWSYGFGFRQSPGRGGSIYVNSYDRAWNAAIYERDAAGLPRSPMIRTWHGGLLNLRTGADETNEMQFVASGPTGYFVLNGEEIAALDLSDLLQPGGVEIGTGYDYLGFGLVPGATTEYRDFTIAPSPVPSPFAARAPAYLYGPTNGGIQQTRQGANGNSTSMTGEGVRTGGTMDNGVLNARFFHPYGAESGLWDYGFWFRDVAGRTVPGGPMGYYSLALRSDRTFILTAHHAVSRAYDAKERQRGPVEVLRTGSGEWNDVELRAEGAAGVLSVNGTEVARFDLSEFRGAGPVTLLTALTVPAQRGAITRYEDFTVAPLP